MVISSRPNLAPGQQRLTVLKPRKWRQLTLQRDYGGSLMNFARRELQNGSEGNRPPLDGNGASLLHKKVLTHSRRT